MTNRTYRVEGMHCPNCVINLESIEDDLAGIKLIFASYQKGQLEVEYDETEVSESQIMAAVESRGYHLKPVNQE